MSEALCAESIGIPNPLKGLATALGLSAVRQEGLSGLHKVLLSEVLPKDSTYIRTGLSPVLVSEDEERMEFKVLSPHQIRVTEDRFTLQYLCEFSSRNFPEFVQEFTRSPFLKEVPLELSQHRYLDKGQHNAILRLSSDLLRQVQQRATAASRCEYSLRTYRTDFYLTNNPSLIDAKGAGVIQIVFSFEMSHVD